MSAADVIHEVEKLTREERMQVLRFIEESLEAESGVRAAAREDRMKASVDKILTQNAELFRKLAQ